MRILGISAFYHDSAAALLVDGRIVAAAQEERFTRKKQDARFPVQAIAYCLEEGNIKLDRLTTWYSTRSHFSNSSGYSKPISPSRRADCSPSHAAIPVWIREKLFQKDIIRRELQKFAPEFDWKKRLLFTEHHISHAASAFYASPFQEAAVLTMDGVGEWCTGSAGDRSRQRAHLLKELHFPHSLGLLYSAFTYYTGFKVNSGEYKVMGLAPYGQPEYVNLILDHLMDLKEDGSFWLDLSYFDYCTGLTMTNSQVRRPVRRAGAQPGQGLTHAFPHEHRGLHSEGHRGSDAASCRAHSRASTKSRIYASRAASRSTAWPTENST